MVPQKKWVGGGGGTYEFDLSELLAFADEDAPTHYQNRTWGGREARRENAHAPATPLMALELLGFPRVREERRVAGVVADPDFRRRLRARRLVTRRDEKTDKRGGGTCLVRRRGLDERAAGAEDEVKVRLAEVVLDAHRPRHVLVLLRLCSLRSYPCALSHTPLITINESRGERTGQRDSSCAL